MNGATVIERDVNKCYIPIIIERYTNRRNKH